MLLLKWLSLRNDLLPSAGIERTFHIMSATEIDHKDEVRKVTSPGSTTINKTDSLQI